MYSIKLTGNIHEQQTRKDMPGGIDDSVLRPESSFNSLQDNLPDLPSRFLKKITIECLEDVVELSLGCKRSNLLFLNRHMELLKISKLQCLEISGVAELTRNTKEYHQTRHAKYMIVVSNLSAINFQNGIDGCNLMKEIKDCDQVSNQIKKLGVKLLDYVIVSEQFVFSFRCRGLLG